MTVAKNINLIAAGILLFFVLACSSGNDNITSTQYAQQMIDLRPTCGNFPSKESCEVFEYPIDSNKKREYILHVPEGEIESSPPLFIFLHGGGGSAGTTPLFFGIRTFLASTKYVGVFPNARLNERGFRSWDFDDVEFIDEVITRLIASNNIDPDRVFIFGFSNGGFLANYLACKIPSRVTAIISHAGNLLAPLADPINNCATDGNVAIHHIHGNADDIIPYQGVEDGILSAEAAINEWSIANQCDAAFINSEAFDLVPDIENNESVTRRYQNCIKPVELTTIDGAGHLPRFDLARLSELMSDFYQNSTNQ